VYVGGHQGNEIFIDKPTIYENDQQRFMYPNEARLKDMTYKADLSANIVVEYITSENGKQKSSVEKIFKSVRIGAIPIMLHSCICALNNQPPKVLHEMGECIYDQGGYFLIGGKEKVIVAQERIVTNKIFINKSKNPKYNYEGLIRCTSEANPLFPKTINFYVNADSISRKKTIDGGDEEDDATIEENDGNVELLKTTMLKMSRVSFPTRSY
jgi:DNA-directed RNA polymerase II subunit RPB2